MGSLDELQAQIGIAFKHPDLLREALTHSSFANESPHVSPVDNERLEYLGDAVLQLITADYLFKNRPDAQEGEMTQVRSAMVNTNTLAALSEELKMGDYLYLGRGIAKAGGRNLRSLLANAFEAVLGAVFLDAGFDAAYHYYLDRFRALPEQIDNENYKGRLQQVVQEIYGQTPYYDSGGARGGRTREYTAVVYAGAESLGAGHGLTKQEAEQQAAKEALAKIDAAAAPPRRRRASVSPSAQEIAPSSELASPSGPDLITPADLAEGPEVAAEAPTKAPPRPRRRRSAAATPRLDSEAEPAAPPPLESEPAPQPQPAPVVDPAPASAWAQPSATEPVMPASGQWGLPVPAPRAPDPAPAPPSTV
ncbi:MAG: ribonuclease III, partial [Candidatus Dormibacteraceae bacterium]